jgi:hypothetical protein
MSVKYKLFKINAIMENGNDNDPIVFTFELPGLDEESIGLVLNKMNSIKRIISVEETPSTTIR